MGVKENRNGEKTANSGNRQASFGVFLKEALQNPVVRQWLIAIFVFFTLVGILQIDLVPQNYKIKVGEESKYYIVAPRTIINRYQTEEAKKEAAAQAVQEKSRLPEYQTISPRAGSNAMEKVADFFNQAEQVRNRLPKKFSLLSKAEQSQAGEEFRRALKETDPGTASIGDQEVFTLLAMDEDRFERIRKVTRTALVALVTEERIGSAQLKTVREKMDLYTQLPRFAILPEDRPVVTELLRLLVFKNLVPDQAKLHQVAAEARKNVQPKRVVQGQVILREGDLVTEEQYQLLQDLNLVDNRGNRLKIFATLFLFILLLLSVGLFYILLFKNKYLRQEHLLYLLGLIAIIILLTAKLLTLLPSPSLDYLIPVVLASILLTVLLDPEMAWVFTVLISLFVAVIADYNLSLAIYYIISGSAAIYSVTHMYSWSQLLRTTVIVAAVNFLSILTIGLLFGEHSFITLLGFGLVGMLNALLSTVLANGMLPFLEHMFGLTSFFSLMELANPSHPLLKRLLIEAPGTYYHSIIVGNLAETAAEAIEADKLLVRVGAYYHDIGKIRRPYFFVENQHGQNNPHEKLNPALSSLIITSHVKDGVELAKEFGLPEVIQHIIEQHHGTDLIRYFYQRASEVYQEEKETVTESAYRYPGPKPQTKEAALIMLADAVEAAARSLKNVTPAKLEGVIQRIIQERMEYRQFDECNLTFRDLDKIREAFMKVLSGIFHHRIEYPEAIIKEMERKKINVGGHSQ
ncbi:MAG TPA: HDIG domain-containing protein [Bacillota bacterium]|nr:HDIG domain-containing protein [Bacillota bacterium]HPT67632.1 HDIG domain-containing protein [Bacillota bacterium]